MGSEHPPLKRESCAEVLRLLTGLLDPGGAAGLHLHSGCRVHVCVSGPRHLAVLLMWWRELSATCLCLPPQGPSEAVCHQIPRHLLGISVSPSKQQRRERLHAGGVTSMLFSVHSAVYFVVYCVLICLKEPRRRFPWNLLLLGIFTLALSYMAGTISSYYETKAVFIAMGITVVVCVAVTVFCFQTKVDLTSCSGLLCIAGVLLMIIGIVTAVVLSFQYVHWLHMLYAAIGAVVYTLFLVYNTQLLIGNRELAISPEEYVFGALSLYVDIVHIFLFILQVSGSATE
uniref:Transmembrane BAX inhibitor motif containing 1b n=1 Tax=Oryzias sinensis TaxID=183150 RepID=A0A8C7XX81_9TELE